MRCEMCENDVNGECLFCRMKKSFSSSSQSLYNINSGMQRSYFQPSDYTNSDSTYGDNSERGYCSGTLGDYSGQSSGQLAYSGAYSSQSCGGEEYGN